MTAQSNILYTHTVKATEWEELQRKAIFGIPQTEAWHRCMLRTV